MTKLIFRSNIYLNSACLQKEEHVLVRASCTNRQDTFMDVIARWIRAITLGKGRHFFDPMAHGIDSRTKEKEAGKEAGKEGNKGRKNEGEKKRKSMKLYELMQFEMN